jgi:hypothetical protein
MVNPEDLIVEEEFDLDLGKEDGPYSGMICLNERGGLSIRFEEGVVPQEDIIKEGMKQHWSSISGRDAEGREINVSNVVISTTSNFSLTELNGTSATIKRNEDMNCEDGVEMVIDFDITLFKTEFPSRDQMDEETKASIRQHSGRDVPEEIEVEYLSRDERSFYGVPLTDTSDRINFIKDRGIPIRTGKIRVRQDISGSIDHQVDRAKQEVEKILEVSQLVQETSPRIIRAKAVGLNESPLESTDVYYEELYTGSTSGIGARFAPIPDKNLWSNFPEYLNEAYKGYTDRVRKDLHLLQVLSYYVDARMTGRTVEGSLLSTCSAIELLSLWHAREAEISGKTQPKIEHTMDELGVEIDDLVKASADDPNEMDSQKYFWKPSRNHVTHGDPNRTPSELWQDREAALILLKRLIRNQLLGETHSEFDKLYSMSPRERIEF